jgi:hypothetical protein
LENTTKKSKPNRTTPANLLMHGQASVHHETERRGEGVVEHLPRVPATATTTTTMELHTYIVFV